MHKLSFGIIALGANLPSQTGSASETLLTAANMIEESAKIATTAISRLWKTPAFPIGSGPDFVNSALTVQTSLTASQLLAALHRIEQALGRDRTTGRWSARVIDLDLIALDELICPNAAIQTEWRQLSPQDQQTRTPDQLILPHPRLQDRGFVLAPLAEIAPSWRHPITGQSVAGMLDALPEGACDGMAPLAYVKSPGNT